MIKQRILTAVILVPITLVALYYLPPPAFLILTGLIAMGGAWEWSNLMEVRTKSARFLYVLIMAFIFAWALFVPVMLLLWIALIWWCVALILVICYPRGSRFIKGWFLRGLMGLFVLLPCWAAINYVRNEIDGLYSLLFLFALIWGADSVAYFTGKKWGTIKLAPKVSPGKTVQGAVCALIFSMLFCALVLTLLQAPIGVWPWAIGLSLITVIFSIVGDLFESMIKRLADVKDSGNLLPGHGGLLDRIDSLTAAAPIFVMGGILLGKYLG